MSSMFGAEQRISKRSSARAVQTRRHARATLFVWLDARVCMCNRPVIVWYPLCRPKVIDIGRMVYTQFVSLHVDLNERGCPLIHVVQSVCYCTYVKNSLP